MAEKPCCGVGEGQKRIGVGLCGHYFTPCFSTLISEVLSVKSTRVVLTSYCFSLSAVAQ